MIPLKFIVIAFFTLVRVKLRQLSHSSKCSRWSKQLELQIEIQRAVMTSGVRGNLAAAKRLTSQPKAPARSIRNRVQCQAIEMHGVPGERIIPDNAGEGVVLFLHGGGYALCSAQFHRSLASDIAIAAGATVYTVSYRLAPEHPFPAAVEDTASAYRWLLEQAIDPWKIVVAGDSAGGGLSLSLLLTLRDSSEAMPAGAALLCPWVDLEMNSESIERNAHIDCLTPEMLRYWAPLYVGSADPKEALISGIHADLTGLPPMLIQTGGADVLVDEGALLADLARDSGVEVTYSTYEQMPHVWHFFGGLALDAQPAIEEVARFTRRVTARNEAV